MSDNKSEGYNVSYEWKLLNICIQKHKLLSSNDFTLENYDKIFFSMSLMKITDDEFRVKINKKGIFNPNYAKIIIKPSNYESQTSKITCWSNHDFVEFKWNTSFSIRNLRSITCHIHLDIIDSELNQKILFRASLISMNKYFLSAQYSDVTIEVKDSDEKLSAHKLVLDFHSSVFEKMFNTDMKEAKENCFHFGEFDMAIVKRVLEFMYTGKIAQCDNIDLIFQILACANMYQITNLQIYCEYQLILNLNIDNVIKILVTIGNLELPKLSEKAKLYLECNSNRISLVDVLKELNNSKILLDFLAEKTGMKIN
ncbi:TD and POZ domain-containing protein 3-like [Cotesia typhae]|uniref:TD and POZ domain-containing protein 3-like n=1 Tax=Cotesia typhae TaxID=2053667 RepID=UPI003D698D83